MRWLVVLLCCSVVSALEVTEIMYNPIGKDSELEWIELYHNESIKGVMVNGKEVPGNISGYVIIARNASQVIADCPVIESVFQLPNKGGTINLTHENISQIITYDNSADDGHSIVMCPEHKSSATIGGSPCQRDQVCTTCGLKINPLCYFCEKKAQFQVIATKDKNTHITVRGTIASKDNVVKSYKPYDRVIKKITAKKTYKTSLKPGMYLINFSMETPYCMASDAVMMQVGVQEYDESEPCTQHECPLCQKTDCPICPNCSECVPCPNCSTTECHSPIHVGEVLHKPPLKLYIPVLLMVSIALIIITIKTSHKQG